MPPTTVVNMPMTKTSVFKKPNYSREPFLSNLILQIELCSFNNQQN